MQSASTGMLVVDSNMPGSSAEGQLDPGDIVVRVQGQVVTHFLTLEAMLDDAVASDVSLSIERGGQPMDLDVQVKTMADCQHL